MAYADEVLADSPLTYLRCEETSGSTFTDEQAHADGTNVGADPNVDGPFGLGSGVQTDGVDDHIAQSVPTLGAALATGVTIAVPINTTTEDRDRLGGTANDGSGVNVEIRVNTNADFSGFHAGALAVFTRSDDGVVVQGSALDADVCDGEDHLAHVKIDRPNDQIIILVDGVEQTVTHGTQGSSTSFVNFQYDWMWGAWNNRGNDDGHIAAVMDEMALFDSLVSNTRLAAHFAAVPSGDLITFTDDSTDLVPGSTVPYRTRGVDADHNPGPWNAFVDATLESLEQGTIRDTFTDLADGATPSNYTPRWATDGVTYEGLNGRLRYLTETSARRLVTRDDVPSTKDHECAAEFDLEQLNGAGLAFRLRTSGDSAGVANGLFLTAHATNGLQWERYLAGDQTFIGDPVPFDFTAPSYRIKWGVRTVVEAGEEHAELYAKLYEADAAEPDWDTDLDAEDDGLLEAGLPGVGGYSDSNDARYRQLVWAWNGASAEFSDAGIPDATDLTVDLVDWDTLGVSFDRPSGYTAQVERRYDGGTPEIIFADTAATSFEDIDQPAETLVEYRVTLRDGDDFGTPTDWEGHLTGTDPDAVPPPEDPPATPENLDATVVSHQRMNTSWSASDTADTYTLEVTELDALLDPVGDPVEHVTSSTAHTLISLRALTSYSMRVKATNEIGDSAYSAAIVRTTHAPPGATPTWTVYARDADLNRTGELEWNRIDVNMRFNQGSRAEITVDASELPKITAGGGVIITLDGEPILSGLAREMTRRRDPGSDERTIGVIGDLERVNGLLVYPDPTQPATGTQPTRDERTGPAETVVLGYIQDNAGPSALVDRRIPGLVTATSESRGETVTGRGRFRPLVEFCAMLCERGSIGFQAVQQGSEIVVSAYTPQEQPGTRFDIDALESSGSLRSFEYTLTRPEATVVIGGGRGEGDGRLFREIVDEDAVVEWGWIEAFHDYRNAGDADDLEAQTAELDDAIADKLRESAAVVDLNLEVVDTEAVQWRRDYDLGDRVRVKVDGEWLWRQVRSVEVTVTSQGQVVRPQLGDAASEELLGLFRRLGELEVAVSEAGRQ